MDELNEEVFVKVSEEEINFKTFSNWHPLSKQGAGNLFIGYVREENLGRQVTGIEYDCYSPMAIKVLNEICFEAKKIFGDETKIYVQHRFGYLKVGEASVAVFATSKHRHESYEASRYVIEELKTRVPIWKKEFYTDGETDWVRGHVLCQHKKVSYEKVRSTSCGGTVHSHEAR